MSLLLQRVGHGDRTWNDLVDLHRSDVELQGYSMHVIELGQGPPVICVHGYCDSSFGWHRTAPALVDAGLRAVLVDQPGMGRSGSPPDHVFAVENQAGEILRLADRLGLERFHLVGHSMGGGITLHLCLHHPARVQRAVVIAPVTKRPSRKLLLGHPGAGLVAELAAGRRVFAHTLRQVFHDPSKVTPEMVEEYARPSTRRGFWLDMARLSRQYFSAEFDRTVERLGDIRVPLLVIWGQQDRWLSARRGPYLVKTIPGTRLEVIPETGHNVHQEQPGRVNPLLVQHLLQGDGAA